MRANLILHTAVVALTVVSFLVSPPAQSIDEGTLKGLDGVYVGVEFFEENEKNAGFSRDTFQTDIELKLRLAGIKVLDEAELVSTPGRPWLYLNVNPLSPQGKQKFPYSINLELKQWVYLARDPDMGTFASTWYTHSVGNGDIPYIRESVKDRVDQFINAYLSVNPK